MRFEHKASGLAAVALAGILGCKNAPPPRGLPEVAVQVIRTEQAVLTTELPGRTSAYLVAEIRPQVNGLIQKRFFQEGTDVRSGSTLYLIDQAPYKAAHEQVEQHLLVFSFI